MDGIYNAAENAGNNIAGLIRSQNHGLCSGNGVSYPGVPSVSAILERLGLSYEDELSEHGWFEACELVSPEN